MHWAGEQHGSLPKHSEELQGWVVAGRQQGWSLQRASVGALYAVGCEHVEGPHGEVTCVAL